VVRKARLCARQVSGQAGKRGLDRQEGKACNESAIQEGHHQEECN
jgi:hypothetical protein